jgi:two-component system, chemotaxis family, response regulator Rcp1
MTNTPAKPIEILLVEDNPGDVRLTTEALRDDKLRNTIHVVADGVEALAYLRHEGRYAESVRPDMILLDLNLPKKSGLEVLKEIKEDGSLKRIPVIMLSTSQAETDIVKSYDLHANAFVTKPVDLEQFLSVVKVIEGFWLEIVRLPNGGGI